MTQKTIECLHCNGKMNIELRNTEPNSQDREIILPSFIPGFRCSEPGCISIHPNNNYNNRVLARCSRCGQFAKNNIGPCPWCKSLNTLQILNEKYLDQIGIPKPN